MTAFGRSSVSTEVGRFVVEIMTVNRKHLEVNSTLPRGFARFEVDVRDWIAEKVARGMVTLRVEFFPTNGSVDRVLLNETLAKQVKSSWEDLSKSLGITIAPDTLIRVLTSTEGIMRVDPNLPEEQTYRDALKEAVESALDQLMSMKAHEGEHLKEDIAQRFNRLESLIERVGPVLEGSVEKYRDRLREAVKTVCGESTESDERVLREMTVFADRIDVAEELTRIQSHLVKGRELLERRSAIGKTLDFLMQEFFREANTIASKASNAEVAHIVVDLKTEIERIREQVANIE